MDVPPVKLGSYSPTSSPPPADPEEDWSYSSEEEIPLNRFETEQIFLTSKLLTVGSRSASMDPLHYVLALVNGHPLVQEETQPREAKDEMRNFCRLFQHGTRITDRLAPSVQELDPTKEAQEFKVASPQQLLAANLSFSHMLEGIILEEIHHNSQYEPFCAKIQADDFRDIEKITNKKIEEKLKLSGFIDADGRLIPGALMSKPAHTALEKEIPYPERREKIIDILHFVELRSEKEMIRKRLTRSTFLDPRLLSEMSRGKLTAEDAHLLLTCLALKVGSKTTMVCDPRTSEFSNAIVNMLRGKNPPSVHFEKPTTVKSRSNFGSKIDLKAATEKVHLISEGTKLVANQIFKTIAKHLKKNAIGFWETVKQERPKAASDHTYLRELFFDETRFQQLFNNAYPDSPDNVKELFKVFRDGLSPQLEKLDELAASLPNQSTVMEDCLDKEAENRIESAVEQEARLEAKFEEVKHLIRPFLLFSIQNFELQQPCNFKLHWTMDGIEVSENIVLEKSCAVMRRLDFPKSNDADRTDLPYFHEGSKPSVAKKWEEICQRHQLSDSQLADLFLKLYREGSIEAHAEIKDFLIPLVILLMGKEPALDRASLIANFILIFSVQLGITTFPEALESMPVIPQGGVSAKQFLLHTSDHPIDTLSGVQYRNNTTDLPSSHYLPTISSFIGRADDWIQKYDDVATVAVQCCQRLLIRPKDEADNRFIAFKKRLETETEGNVLKIWELPLAIDCKGMAQKITAIENICQNFALLYSDFANSTGARHAREAVKFCKMKLISCKDDEFVQEHLIDPLNALFAEIIEPFKLVKLLDLDYAEDLIRLKQEIANEFLISMGEQDELETAAERCQAYLTRGIDPADPKIQNLKILLEKVYKIPIPYAHLASAIEYNIGLNDDDDEIGKWAIDYLFAFHPLSQ